MEDLTQGFKKETSIETRKAGYFEVNGKGEEEMSNTNCKISKGLADSSCARKRKKRFVFSVLYFLLRLGFGTSQVASVQLHCGLNQLPQDSPGKLPVSLLLWGNLCILSSK